LPEEGETVSREERHDEVWIANKIRKNVENALESLNTNNQTVRPKPTI
jgi:hypothetical protein